MLPMIQDSPEIDIIIAIIICGFLTAYYLRLLDGISELGRQHLGQEGFCRASFISSGSSNVECDRLKELYA